MHKGSAWVLSATSRVKPGRRRSSGGVLCRYSPGECRWSYSITCLCQEAAGFPRGSTWALPAQTLALPGLQRNKP
ncbi:hypothetical protein DPMN_085137 [Dreissena polymorpha]|uniref:Uncharacterized protein n=1 Tax=Dreissena polymorpha TaxID=45954 RepID=A0A9D3YD36_DREPO|nr:hypothetical protein DPMN_085137 [Dreissena polymorpha]